MQALGNRIWKLILEECIAAGQSVNFATSDRAIRSATISILLLGFTYASTNPYQVIIGIKQLGLSEGQFGLTMFAMGLSGMLGNLIFGHISDLIRDRKIAILGCLVLGTIGFGSFGLFPNLYTFLFCILFVYPISNSAYSQLFAVVRRLTADMPASERVATNSAVRSAFALSWILVPGFVGFLLAHATQPSDSFLWASFAFLICAVYYLYFGPSTAESTQNVDNLGFGLSRPFKMGIPKEVVVRLLALALVQVGHPLNVYLLPLVIMDSFGGSTVDIGVLAGVVAAFEIPLMLFSGSLNRRLNVWIIVVLGGMAHAAYFVGLVDAKSIFHIYLLSILNAAGAAVLLNIHLSYIQDLLPDRPGFATSLMSVVSLCSRAVAASAFAGVGSSYGLATCAIIGTASILVGCGSIVVLDGSVGMRR